MYFLRKNCNYKNISNSVKVPTNHGSVAYIKAFETLISAVCPSVRPSVRIFYFTQGISCNDVVKTTDLGT